MQIHVITKSLSSVIGSLSLQLIIENFSPFDERRVATGLPQA
jgi:hypothetical protein